MSNVRRFSTPARQRGLAMVELVMTAPILLLLMFATVIFGEFLIDYNTLNDGVRDAARYVSGAANNGTDGTLVPTTSSVWTTLVSNAKNLAVYGNVNGTGNAVLPGLGVGQITVGQTTATDTITVSAAYPYTSLFGASMPSFFGGTISTNFNLQISTTMRAL
jgi:Flp pilus assembly protein TadG